MAKKTGLEYLDENIDSSGVIGLDQVGFRGEKYNPAYDVISLHKRNNSYNPNIGDRVSYTDDLTGISDIANMSDEELQNAKYETQTGLEMVANALKGMAAIAGTTYISNTVGLGNMALEMTWDNTVNNYMAELENEARARNQIYRPSDYDEWSLMQKLGNGVFWADLVQNLGFTIGAGAAAATLSVIPGMSILGKAPKLIQAVAPSLFAAVGEASIEAVHHKNEEVQRKSAEAIASYKNMISNSLDDETAESLSQELSSTLYNITEDERKAGNFVFGANLALLTLSNSIEFGDIFARGFSSGRRAVNAAGRTAEQIMTDGGMRLGKESLKGAAARGTIGGLINNVTESAEEVSQGIITKAASLNADFDTFNESKFNTEKREKVSGMMQSLIAGYAEAMHDPNTAVEAAMGFFTGAIGRPSLRKSIIPVRLEGGVVGSIASEIAKTKEFNRQIDLVNARLANSEDLNTYYEGLTRHLVLQDYEDVALEGNDHKAFADANSAKFISDIMMFDKVGRLDMLRQIIDKSANLSDEEIQAMIQETSNNGNGPFISNGNAMSIDEVRNLLKEKAETLKDRIDSYTKEKDFLTSRYGELSDASLEEALFYKMSMSDLEERQKSMAKNTDDSLYNLIESYIISKEEELDVDERIGVSQLWEATGNKKRLAEASDKSSALHSAIQTALDSDTFAIPTDIKEEISTLLSDYSRIEDTKNKYLKSFNSLIENPQEANARHIQKQQQVADADKQRQHNQELQQIVDSMDELEIGELADKILANEVDPEDERLKGIKELDPDVAAKMEEAVRMATVMSKVLGVNSEGEIDALEDATEEQKQKAKALFAWVAKHADSTDAILDLQTYETLTDEQLAEAFGVDPNADLDSVYQELGENLEQALEALNKALPEIASKLEELEAMAVGKEVDLGDIEKQVGKNQTTQVQSANHNTSSHVTFPEGSTISGTDVSGKTVDEVTDMYEQMIKGSEKDGILISDIVETFNGKKLTVPSGVVLQESDLQSGEIPESFEGTISLIQLRIDKSGRKAATVRFSPIEGSSFVGEVKLDNSYDLRSHINGKEYKDRQRDKVQKYLQSQLKKARKTTSNTTTKETDHPASESPTTSRGWTSGFSYMYMGKNPEHKGKTSLQSVRDEIKKLEDKEKVEALTAEEKRILKELKAQESLVQKLTDRGVYTRERQAKAQVGTVIHFIVDPSISTEDVLLAVKEHNGTYTIVGSLAPYNAKGIMERYAKSNSTSLYVDQVTTKVLEKKIGTVPYTETNNKLSNIFSGEFTLAIDLSTGNSEYADLRTLANSEATTPKTEEEEHIRAPKKGSGGVAYVLIPTSDAKNTRHVVARVISGVFNMAESNSVTAFLKRLQDATSISYKEKLAYLQALLDIDIYVEDERYSMTEEGNTQSITYKVYSKGISEQGNKRTSYGRKTSTDKSIVSDIISLVDKKARYTVDRKYINSEFSAMGEDYNSVIGDVLYSNLEEDPATVGDWFTIEPISKDGSMVVGKNLSSIKAKPKTTSETIEVRGVATYITIGDHTLMINTSTWEVERDGQPLKQQDYNAGTYKYLAETFLKQAGESAGVHMTPWGAYDMGSRQYIKGASYVSPSILQRILLGLNSGLLEGVVNSIIQYEDLPESSKSPGLTSLINAADLALEKQGVLYTHPEHIKSYWEKGQRENIKVIKYIENPNLPYGEQRVVSVDVPIIEITDPNTGEVKIIKAEVVVETNSKQGNDNPNTSNTTGPAAEVISDESAEWIPNEDLRTIYLSLSPEAKAGFKVRVEPVLTKKGPKAVKDRYLTTLLDTLKPMSAEQRNEQFTMPEVFRKQDPTEKFVPIDIQKELKWLDKVLPQFSKNDRVRVLKGLITIANAENVEYAWGKFKDGIMYIAQNAASGTVYHEAFHAVVHTLLTSQEIAELIKAAKEHYGISDLAKLEEKLADDFMRYTFDMSEASSGIKSWWKKLKDLIRHLFHKMSYIESMFYRINKGMYARRNYAKTVSENYRKKKDKIDPFENFTTDELQAIVNAHTTYRKESLKARKILSETSSKSLYYYSDLRSILAEVPNVDEVVKFVEVPTTGRYKPVLYIDLMSKEKAKLAKEMLNEMRNPSPTQDTATLDDYLSQVALLEQEERELINDGLDEYIDDTYSVSMREYENRRSQALKYDNLSEGRKAALAEQGISKEQFDALDDAEKSTFFYCYGI